MRFKIYALTCVSTSTNNLKILSDVLSDPTRLTKGKTSLRHGYMEAITHTDNLVVRRDLLFAVCTYCVDFSRPTFQKYEVTSEQIALIPAFMAQQESPIPDLLTPLTNRLIGRIKRNEQTTTAVLSLILTVFRCKDLLSQQSHTDMGQWNSTIIGFVEALREKGFFKKAAAPLTTTNAGEKNTSPGYDQKLLETLDAIMNIGTRQGASREQLSALFSTIGNSNLIYFVINQLKNKNRKHIAFELLIVFTREYHNGSSHIKNDTTEEQHDHIKKHIQSLPKEEKNKASLNELKSIFK